MADSKGRRHSGQARDGAPPRLPWPPAAACSCCAAAQRSTHCGGRYKAETVRVVMAVGSLPPATSSCPAHAQRQRQTASQPANRQELACRWKWWKQPSKNASSELSNSARQMGQVPQAAVDILPAGRKGVGGVGRRQRCWPYKQLRQARESSGPCRQQGVPWRLLVWQQRTPRPQLTSGQGAASPRLLPADLWGAQGIKAQAVPQRRRCRLQAPLRPLQRACGRSGATRLFQWRRWQDRNGVMGAAAPLWRAPTGRRRKRAPGGLGAGCTQPNGSAVSQQRPARQFMQPSQKCKCGASQPGACTGVWRQHHPLLRFTISSDTPVGALPLPTLAAPIQLAPCSSLGPVHPLPWRPSSTMKRPSSASAT